MIIKIYINFRVKFIVTYLHILKFFKTKNLLPRGRHDSFKYKLKNYKSFL